MLKFCGIIIYVIKICGCGGTGRRAGLRNQYFGVGVQVPSSAPTTYLFELTDRLKIIQVSWMIFFFAQKTSSNILKRKDGA